MKGVPETNGKVHHTKRLDNERFVYNLAVAGNKQAIDQFIFDSSSPAQVAVELSKTLGNLSREKNEDNERANEFKALANHCEEVACKLLSLACINSNSHSKILEALVRTRSERDIPFLDFLIQNEQRRAIALHTVQNYLKELWLGRLKWGVVKLCLLFTTFVFIPPIWIAFSIPIPLGHGPSLDKIPVIKFLLHLTSHIYLIILLLLTSVTPIYPVLRNDFEPYWMEWLLLIFTIGLALNQLHVHVDVDMDAYPTRRNWREIGILICLGVALLIHCSGYFVPQKAWHPTIFYCRNMSLAIPSVLAVLQLMDFLIYNNFFGPWIVIHEKLMGDVYRFGIFLFIYLVAYSFIMSALNQPFSKRDINSTIIAQSKLLTNGLPSGVLMTPLDAFELGYFSAFGWTGLENTKIEPTQPVWTIIPFRIVFGGFIFAEWILSSHFFIAMMETYKRVKPGIEMEWKFRLMKSIRMEMTKPTWPSPINLFIILGSWIVKLWRCGPCNCVRGQIKNESALPVGTKKEGEGRVRIETAADWPGIVKKYREIVTVGFGIHESEKRSDNNHSSTNGSR